MSKNLSSVQAEQLLKILKTRFAKNTERHQDLVWDKIQEKLLANPEKLWSLAEMENTGGEPDVIAYDQKTKEYIFGDCSAETPKGRRSLCYDEAALKSRKEFKPKSSAVAMATEMGTALMTEDDYQQLQTIGEFDLKTSSWLQTPAAIRKLGGAIFADRRYDHVFIYHNGAESYYAVRGFRVLLRV